MRVSANVSFDPHALGDLVIAPAVRMQSVEADFDIEVLADLRANLYLLVGEADFEPQAQADLLAA